MKLKNLSILLLLAGLQPAPVLFAGTSAGALYSIYGADDRLDYFQADKQMQRLAGSTAAMFKDSVIPYNEEAKVYRLKPLSLEKMKNLKPGQRFGGQTTGSFCSAALVGEDLALTSGHCFLPDPRGGPCERIKFVFGYALAAENGAPTVFPEADVYSCREILAQVVQDDVASFSCKGDKCADHTVGPLGADFALVKLDRPVAGRAPLLISRTPVAPDARLTAIGYPTGLPVKIAGNGRIREITSAGYFVTDLDTFGGNSGGPVFNSATLRIEGVLVRGGVDYIYGSATPVPDPKNPYEHESGDVNVYPQGGGRGEDVTLCSVFQALVPKTDAEARADKLSQLRPAQQRMPVIELPGVGGAAADPGPSPLSAPRPVGN